MDDFSLPRRIWRAINPTLIYLLVSTVISSIFIVAFMVADIGFDLDIIMDFERFSTLVYDKALIASLFGYIAGLIVFVPMWIRTKANYPRWNNGRFSVPVALCSAGAALGINLVLSFIISRTNATELFETHNVIVDIISSESLLLQIIAAGLIGPIAEELCFRGVTLSRMSVTKTWLAIAVSSVLFGVLHMNILQGIYATLLGVFLGFLTVRYRNIIYAVIAHIAFNMYSIVLGSVESNIASIIIVIAIIIAAIASVYGLIRCKRPEPYVPPETRQPVPMA